ncbi:PadR family transcriptional regulator [Paenibacillus faecis]|uniref:PadR family transcriptional regulator n=1 Tax=Paenibacillus faecis TaxID=862114 RepID=A0A5D0CXF3_9BACL|nr:PadR family transcriptional regulator [Paenibacillus faecis]TYA14709.1 PadR family transcriptional regulator [Paenibacillus faecis]GIO84212.1 PadR family transcriptional regulator [Paenibacillus faecis]
MYADILILGQLLTGPKHGYEIKKNVQEALGESFEINNNLLYPALRRFQEMGAMTKEVEKADGKPDRHVYLLTETGEEIFDELVRDFPRKAAANQMEFLVRVALFDRLEPELRLDILRKRLSVLEEEMERNRRFDLLHSQNGFTAEVIRFKKAQTEHELAWVKQWILEFQAPAPLSNSDTDRFV